ncbi:MAG TPA: hypothetical protein VM513_10575 [Kofleriaceae bacterium]|jgi:hypothetical protein|nr:hypothetical protein [Kofleriaceae bacterium]
MQPDPAVRHIQVASYTAYLFFAGYEERSHQIEDKFLADCPH